MNRSGLSLVRLGLTIGLLMAGSLPASAQVVGGTIEGLVTDTSSQPLDGICVRAWDAFGEVSSDSTDIDGTFSIALPADGTYRVLAVDCVQFRYGERWWDNQLGLSSADLISVSGGTVVTGIDLTLLELGSVSGTLTGPGSQPLGNRCVLAARTDGSGASGIGTALDGTYTVAGLEPADYRIQFSDCLNNLLAIEWWDDAPDQASADVITVGEGTDVTGIDAVMAPPTSEGIVSGSVTDDRTGSGITGICVTAWDSAGNQVGAATTTGMGAYSMVVDAGGPLDGDYKVRFEDCGAGVYATVWHSSPEFEPFGSSFLALPVHVVKGETTDVDQRMLPSGTYEGAVVDSATGQPLAGICVLATITDVVIAETTTDSNGEFAISMPQGAYFILFADCVDGSHASRWNAENSDPAFQVLSLVTGGETYDYGTVLMDPGESAFAQAQPTTILSTYGESDGATAADPLEVTVITTGPPGIVTIDEQASDRLPSGDLTLGYGVRLYLPSHLETLVTGADLVGPQSTITFELHSSLLTNGVAPDVVRNGDVVADCPAEDAGFLGICVQQAVTLDNGNVAVTVITTEGSTWEFAYTDSAVVDPDGLSTIPLTGSSESVLPLVGLGLVAVGVLFVVLARGEQGN